MENDSRYRVMVHTDEQITLMEKISECYLRERMGQFEDLAEDLAGEGSGYTYDNNDKNNEVLYQAYTTRREEAERLFLRAYRAAGADGLRREKANQAGDLFVTIRHALWLERPEPKPHDTNDAHPCYKWSKEQSPPECFKENDDWILEMSRVQLRLLQDMSEDFMRERAGQFFLLADSLAYECSGAVLDKSNPCYEKELHRCIENSKNAQRLFEQAFKASGADNYPYKTKRMCMAYDFYSVIRHALWLENPDPDDHLASGDPIHECREMPLIETMKINDYGR